MTNINIKVLNTQRAKDMMTNTTLCPVSQFANGLYDVSVYFENTSKDYSVILQPGELRALPTGIVVESKYHIDIRPRSSTFLLGLMIEGTIDPDYRGEIKILTKNISDKPIQIYNHQKIAQFHFWKEPALWIEYVEEITQTVRGQQGFGSTGQFHKEAK